LKQVVAHTIEAGLRGETQSDDATVRWHAGAYRATADDDILFTASSVIGRGFFRNIGETRRQGIEASADLAQGPWVLSLNYAFTDATFSTAVTLNSPDNPLANANGEIHVRPDDRLPSIPRETVKLLIAYRPDAQWQFNLSARYADGSYLRGDESNLNTTTKSYVVLNAAGTWRVTNTIELFADVENLLDTKYATFGTFSPVDDVPIVQVPNADNPRSLSPGAPLAVSGGIRIQM
jgi:outer membrane receptor protein involved in Fe transport